MKWKDVQEVWGLISKEKVVIKEEFKELGFALKKSKKEG